MKLFIKYSFLILTIIATAMLSSCATLTGDIQVETQAAPNVDFNKFKTFAWAGSAQVVFDPIGQWEQPTLDTDEELRFVINSELRERGINQVENHPDLLVTFAAGVDMTVLELKEDPQGGKRVPVNVPKTALVIALIDASSGYVVWLGHATGNVQKQQSIENIRKRIDYAVRQIFKSYNQ